MEDDLPLDDATIAKNKFKRVPYLEAREAVELEQTEIKAVKAQIGAEVREKCRPEIDEYIDCCVGRIFTIGQCKPHALRMRRCLKKVETPEFVERRMAEIRKERESTGESVINNTVSGRSRNRRALYNNAILSTADDEADIA